MCIRDRYWGIRDVRNIRKVIAIEMRIGFFLALFTVVLALVFAPQILHLFVREADVVAIGASYPVSYTHLQLIQIYLR